jgi:glycosyltransferase involved in cell wall biosynthesis/trans-aconitate methyltransferase
VKRICILVVSYNAADLLLRTLERIPPEVMERVEEVVVFDDASHDESYDAAWEYKRRHGIDKLKVLRNRKTRGYGGNQKRGYQYCLHRGFDVVVLLHGDGQYAPEILWSIVAPVVNGEADAVLGSRMMPGCDPRAGGMPMYKYYGNRILTAVQRRLTGLRLSEFHSGYRAYSCAALRKLPLVCNTETWHFDTQILLELFGRGLRLREVPIPTYYGDEVCRVNGIPYAMHCVAECGKFRLARWGVWRSKLYDTTSPTYAMKDHAGSSHRTILELMSTAPAGSHVLDVGTAGGYLDRELTARGLVVTGIEQDAATADEARAACQELMIGDVEALDLRPYAARFDYVILGDVLEHLKNPDAALRRILETLKPGGKVIACVPNVANIYVRLGLLAGRFAYEPRGIMDATHLRFFTLASFRELMQGAGLEIQHLRATAVPLPMLFPRASQRAWFRGLFGGLLRLTAWWKRLLGYQFVIEAEKAPWLEAIHHGHERRERAQAATVGRP